MSYLPHTKDPLQNVIDSYVSPYNFSPTSTSLKSSPTLDSQTISLELRESLPIGNHQAKDAINRNCVLAIGNTGDYFIAKYGESWIDIVFDIDGTLAFRNPRLGPPDIVIDGHPYKFAHGAVELVAGLQKMKTTLSFFSAGEANRNSQLLNGLFSKIEKQTGISPPTYTVLSRDLISPDQTKNLNLLVSRNLNLQRTVLIDDHPYVSYEGQSRNLLSVYFDINDIMVDDDQPESKKEQLEQVRLKNNLVRAAGVFIMVLENAKTNGTEIVEELDKIESVYRNPDMEGTNSEEIYLKGLAFLRTVNPEFELYTEISYFHPPSRVYPYPQVPGIGDTGSSV